MPRKVRSEPEPEPEIEPEGTQEEVEEIQEIQEETKPEPILPKPKRILTERQLENLKKAREAALLKKKELKELAQKAKALPKKEIEVKAAEYDKLVEKKKQILEAPKAVKKTVKKVIEEEEEEEAEKPIKKVTINTKNSLEQNVSMLSIQQQLKLERQKLLMNALAPMG